MLNPFYLKQRSCDHLLAWENAEILSDWIIHCFSSVLFFVSVIGLWFILHVRTAKNKKFPEKSIMHALNCV